MANSVGLDQSIGRRRVPILPLRERYHNPAGGAPKNYPNNPSWSRKITLIILGGCESAVIRYQWEGESTAKSAANPSADVLCFVKSSTKKALIMRKMAQNLAHT